MAAYIESRTIALTLLRNALRESDWSAIFRATESYRAGAEGQEKTGALLRALRALLRDLMLIGGGQPGMVRNTDILRELSSLTETLRFSWIEQALRSVDEVESGMRRNLLRSLSLDAMAAGFGRLAAGGRELT